MKQLINYLNTYGNYDFSEEPFNDIDNLIFSQLVYTDFEGILDMQSSLFLCDAAVKFYALNDEKDIDKLIGISEKSARLLYECSKTKRFAYVRLSRYINNVNEEIDKQFAAINFELSKESLVVAFRGTDVTVTGVKESAMLSYMFPVPAQIQALYYFQESAMLHKGEIRILGHSKGGNLAVFAGVSCSNSLKKRIVEIYEDDAPGFPKWFFERYDYLQIKDKIRLITPQTSIVGRMLYHDEKPVIIESANSGLRQHQVSSWEIDGTTLKPAEKYDSMSDFISDYINTLIDYIGDDDLQLFFDTIEYVAENMGIDDFYDIKTVDIKRIFRLIDSLSILDEAQKERFKIILKKASADFAKEYFSIRKNEYIEKYIKPKS